MSAPVITLKLSVDAINLTLMGLQQLTLPLIADIQRQAQASIDEFNAPKVSDEASAPDVVDHEGAAE